MNQDGYHTFADMLEHMGTSEAELHQQMLDERLTIRYRMGGKWFKASSEPLNAYDSVFEVSRIYRIPSVSRVMVYDKNGDIYENWCKADDRREDRDLDRYFRKQEKDEQRGRKSLASADGEAGG